MVNTYESVGGLEERNPAFGHRFGSNRIASLSMLSLPISYRYVLSIIIACVIGSLIATIASSQELPNDASTAGITGFPNGWWPSKPEQAALAPKLMISMTEPADFSSSHSLRTLPAQMSSGQMIASRPTTVTGLSNFSLTDVTLAAPSLSADSAPLPAPDSFAFLQSESPSWQSLLADSHSLNEANEASVHPLLQVNYAGWQLPVTLYTAPLRDEAVR
jgi:hypothetical protein